MANSSRQSIQGPFAWTGSDMAVERDWVELFTDQELTELEKAVASVKKKGLALFDIRKKDFPLDQVARRLEKARHELEHGRGMVVLRGLPVDRLTEEQTQCALWGMGVHIGVPLSQSAKGDLLGEVSDQGSRLGMADSRGYRGNHALPFHSDRSDYVALLCFRAAKSGGLSRVVSSVAVHNEMLLRRPELVDALYEPFYMSRQGDVGPGQAPYYVAPIFGIREGKFSSHLAPSYIRAAQTFEGVPRLTQNQQEAFALIPGIAEELALSTDLQLGDIQFLNNHVMFHGRTAFEDYEGDPTRKRTLYRLWLSSPIGRALPENSKTLWGSVELGAVRGGVLAKDGWWRDALSRQAVLEGS